MAKRVSGRSKKEAKPSGEASILTINGQEIWPGHTETIRLYVGRLPIGARVYIRAVVYRSAQPGPAMLVLGGMHGDEITGTEIVRKAMTDGLFDQLLCGTVIAIPILNIYGFLKDARDVPDGKDVNRSFPGNSKGSLASRLARAITRHVLPVVDFGVDFHSGGDARYNYPQVRFTTKDPEARELARVFDAPVRLAKSTLAGSMRKIAFEMGIPMLVYEGGESKRMDNFSVARALDGLRRVLQSKGMLPAELPLKLSNPIAYRKSTWLRAAVPGILNLYKSSGQPVFAGEPIGCIWDPYGSQQDVVYADRPGFIIGHNNIPVVNQGDALFHIAYESFDI